MAILAKLTKIDYFYCLNIISLFHSVNAQKKMSEPAYLTHGFMLIIKDMLKNRGGGEDTPSPQEFLAFYLESPKVLAGLLLYDHTFPGGYKAIFALNSFLECHHAEFIRAITVMNDDPDAWRKYLLTEEEEEESGFFLEPSDTQKKYVEYINAYLEQSPKADLAA